MKHFLILAFLSLVSAQLSGQEIKRVFRQHYTAEEFKTISGYFSNGEKLGPRIVKRSNPADWDGFYFIVEFSDRPERFQGKISVTLEIISALSPKPQSYSFNLVNEDHLTWEAYFGLTGSDWPDSELKPIAWKITAKDIEGTVISSKQSFLWE